MSCEKDGGLPSLPDPDDVCSAMDDINFMRYCYDNFDVNKDGKVSKTEANAVREIRIELMGIKSLKGIQYFSNLTFLDCKNNDLNDLNVSKNTALTKLDCSYNALTSLDVNKNTALLYLYCSYNHLTSLDISKNTKLDELICDNNALTSLVSMNAKLIHLNCKYNRLKSLDVSKNTKLYWLTCSYNELTNLDVSNNTMLNKLVFNYNKFSTQSLNSLFTDLPITEYGTISFRGNPGYDDCDISIYQKKGWHGASVID